MTYNEKVLHELCEEIDSSVNDALADNPGVNSDDVFHDICMSICRIHEHEHPEEVNEIWRRNTGETWQEFLAEVEALQYALRKEEPNGAA